MSKYRTRIEITAITSTVNWHGIHPCCYISLKIVLTRVMGCALMLQLFTGNILINLRDISVRVNPTSTHQSGRPYCIAAPRLTWVREGAGAASPAAALARRRTPPPRRAPVRPPRARGGAAPAAAATRRSAAGGMSS